MNTYEVNKYSIYFDIDDGYYPEINESSIRDPKNKWQSTFPHEDIVKLLKLTERALSRNEKKSLWLEGAYGTGKSRILWMMQNLLTCSDKEFDDYFEDYDNLKQETDLRERFKTIRKGKIVTARRYATGDITSTQKLIFAVFESLTVALKEGGYKFDGAKTLRGKIASWLESDKANLEMFQAKIKKPEYRMSASLSNKSAEEIVKRLKDTNAVVSQLVEEILKLGEREGIRAFSINMEDLTEWITEVTAENKLTAIVLFWDEFSKFFFNNRNNFDEFQRLAELSNIVPFYLVIATHESESLAGEGDKGFKILYDRFIHKNITMPDNIAFELIGHAFKVNKFAKDQWEEIFKALIKATDLPRQAVMKAANINKEKILTDILPIHPISAILLKNLASYFASNQRSIFNFIKNSDPNIKAFQDFIATKSPDDGDLLTADYLWNFFYESGTDEYGGNVGRMNLKPSIRAILDSYANCNELLTPEEQAVLKTILLLQAIDTEAHGTFEFFRPTEKNLNLAFTGDRKLEGGRAIQIANELVRKEILFRKPGTVETFATMSLSGDLAEIEKKKKEIVESVRTAELVMSGNLISVINLNVVQNARYILYPVTADNFTQTINRITNEKNDYHIKAVVCFARNEDEQSRLHYLINGAVENSRYHRLVFADASSNLMNSEVFKRWAECSANETYWRGKDTPLADKMKINAEDCLKSWKQTFENGSFVYYPATKNTDEKRNGISCQNAEKVCEELKDNVRRLYPYSFDDADITNTLFQSSQLKKLAESGITQEEYSMLKARQAKIILGDVWKMSGRYWEVYPDLNISRLKIELDKFIKTEINKNIRVSFDAVFDFLLERGFMPLNIYAYLTGFLLKEYAGDPYRFSAGVDGDSGGAMTVQKLAECIGESIKQAMSPGRNYRPKYIEIMSQNQQQFMKFASEIFNVTENVSVEQSAQKLRLKLNTLNCPLWCYVDAAEDKYVNFLQLIMETANSRQAVAVSSLAEKAGEFLINTPEAFHDLKIFLTEKKGYEIFVDFLKNFEDGIIFELAQKIGIEDVVTECQRRVTSGDSIWLHDKETSLGVLKNLVVDYQIVLESSKFGIDGKSVVSCAESWKRYCNFKIKIPSVTMSDYYPELKDFFSVLTEICRRNDIPQSNREKFLHYLTEYADKIADAFSSQILILKEKFGYSLTGLNDEEISTVYEKMPISSFTDTQGRFVQNLNLLIKREKSGRLNNDLKNLWREVADNKFPREWSKENRTPILAMIPQSELSNAKKVFETLEASSPDEREVQFVMEYLQKRPAYFSALNDKSKIETAFKAALTGKYRGLLDDNDEVRNELEKLNIEPYHWYNNTRVNDVIEAFAKNKYYNGGAYDKVTARVMQMSDEDAKKLLIELLDKNYEVGLKLLRES